MKLKKNLKNSTSDFFYDLTDGGYLNPDEMCENPEDARKVKEAITVIVDFKESCEDQIEDFIQ